MNVGKKQARIVLQKMTISVMIYILLNKSPRGQSKNSDFFLSTIQVTAMIESYQKLAVQLGKLRSEAQPSELVASQTSGAVSKHRSGENI